MRFVVAVVAASVVAVGCSQSPLAPDRATAAASIGTLAISASAPVKTQTADVLSSADGTTVYGSARLVRNDAGITVDVNTAHLVPGDVYTLWWIVEQPSGEIVTNAAGGIVDQKGRAHFGGHLSVGPLPADPDVTLEGSVFDSAFADVILIVHHHGPKVPGIVGKMLATFETGCTGGCVDDPQFAFFPAP